MTEVKYTFETEGKNVVGVITFGEIGKSREFIVGYILELNGVLTRKLVTYTGETRESPLTMAVAKSFIAGKSLVDAFRAGLAELGSAAPPISEADILDIGKHVAVTELLFDKGMFLTGIRKTKKGGVVTYEFITRDANLATKTYSTVARMSTEDETTVKVSYKECDPQKVVALIEDRIEGPDVTFESSLNVTCVAPPSNSFWFYFIIALFIACILYGGVTTGIIPRNIVGLKPLSPPSY